MPAKRPSSRIVDARYVASAATPAQLPPPTGVEIAFAGRSNVGKSSLLNAITGRRSLARTSRTPGCTRQITLFAARLEDGAQITLVDLPGYGYAKRAKQERAVWADLIEDYLLGRATLKAVALLIDVRRGPEAEELGLLELLRQPPRISRNPLETLVIATKLDKVAPAAQKVAIEKMKRALGCPVAGFSTRLPEACPDLVFRIRRAVGLVPDDPAQR